jgi:hypothetical protein
MKRTPEQIEKASRRVHEVKKKYGDNRWWESEDPVHLATWQLFEPILMCDFSKFHEGVEKLLDRPVYTHEFVANHDELLQQATIAIHRREIKSDFTTIPQSQRVKQIIGGVNKL